MAGRMREQFGLVAVEGARAVAQCLSILMESDGPLDESVKANIASISQYAWHPTLAVDRANHSGFQ
jgi:hypothetical protein